MAAVEREIGLGGPPFGGSCVAVVPLEVIELPKLICSSQSEASMREGGAVVRCSESSPVCTSCGSVTGVRQLRLVPDSDSRSQGKVTSTLAPDSINSSCRRRLLCDFEKDLTFRPKLNDYSLKLASKNTRNSLPVVHRLSTISESRKKNVYQENLTFVPKLNALSLKLAQERSSRMPEVQARAAQLAAMRTAEAYAHYTFKPHVSERSQRIAQGLGSNFLSRQEMHIQRRQKAMDEVYKPSPCRLSRPKRLIRLLPKAPPATTCPEKSPTARDEVKENTPQSSHSEQSKTDDALDHKYLTASPINTEDRAPKSPCKSRTPAHSSKSDERPSSLPLCSPSRQSLSQKSPRKHHRRKSNSSAASTRTNTPSPVKSTKGKGDSLVSSPETRVPLYLTARFKNLNDGDRVKRVRVVTERIIKAKKVFLVQGGYPTISRCLRKRGWVELDYKRSQPNKGCANKEQSQKQKTRQPSNSLSPGWRSSSDDDSDVGEREDQDSGDNYSDEEEYYMLSRGVRNSAPNFVWALKRDEALYRTLHSSTIVNHFAKASSFTTKVGLCSNLHNLLWYGDTDPNTFFPRCYRLGCVEEKDTFVDDYRFTAALCLLKLVQEQFATPASYSYCYSAAGQSSTNSALDQKNGDRGSGIGSHGEGGGADKGTGERSGAQRRAGEEKSTDTGLSRVSSSVSRPSSKQSSRPPSRAASVQSRPSFSQLHPPIPEEALELALRACEAYLCCSEHDDIEGSQFMEAPKLTETEWSTLLQHFYTTRDKNCLVMCRYQLVMRANDILEEMESRFPQLHMDGIRNIWIVKPGAMSRGRGVVCMSHLSDILELVNSHVHCTEGKWVIQKYIERPLLIHSTKFDIRQWFLVTDWNPLTMWMYKDCYLRFSTQEYSLEDLDEKIHLCNNSIQKNYENSSTRSDQLPQDNMWDNDTFQEHLSSLGVGDKWDSVIYPGMRQALIHVLQVTQDAIEYRKNSFELYGADFMISERDLKPWLIEINCSPTMEASTSVTSRLCRKVMQDTIKVVLDRREDKDCDIGRFELAYKQAKLDVPSYIGIQLCVCGSAISKPKEQRPAASRTTPIVKLSYRS